MPRGKKGRAEDRKRDDDGTGRLDFDAIYGTGAAIGIAPRDIDLLSLGEFISCVEGWNRVHGAPDKPEPPSEERFEKMLAKIEKRK